MGGGRAYHNRVSVAEQLDIGGVKYEAIKQPVRFRTQGDILNLGSGAPLSPDGAPVNAGDRIGVMQQAIPSQNGLYRVVFPGTGSNGQWVRDGDLPTGALTTSKLLVGVQEGTDAGKFYFLDTTGTPLVGTDPLPFTELGGGGSGLTGVRRTLRFEVDGSGGAGNIDSVTSILAGNRVFEASVDVTVAFDGAAVLDVGDTATANLLIDQGSIDLTTTDTYVFDQDTAWTIASVVRATLGGAPTTGTAIIEVVYGLVDA